MYNGPGADFISPRTYTLFSTGLLKGMRFRFEGITGNSYLKMVGATSKTSASFVWQMLKSGGSFYGNINGKSVGSTTWSITQGGTAAFPSISQAGSAVLDVSDVDDAPVDAATTAPISSNWAFDHEAGGHPAANIPTNISNFDGALSAADDTVQKALETLDESPGIAGPTGATGADSTVPGVTGVTGADSTVPGVTGVTGVGDIGPTGVTGIHGQTGVTGFDGLTGVTGAESTVPGETGVTGITGITGTTGDTGDQGTTGITGIDGLTGVTGADSTVPGETGVTGIDGLTGVTGTTGDQGITGLTGLTGVDGLTGVTGDTGDTGVTGTTGDEGPTGVHGITGITGTTGDEGPTGVHGITGITGTTGDEGPTGVDGLTGATGTTGDAGPTGITGLTGVTGNIGVTGTVGDQGTTGVTGADGLPPATAVWEYSDGDTIDSDPGAGKFKTDNSTWSSITEIYIDNVDADSVTQTSWLATWDDSTSTNASYLEISSSVGGGYSTYWVTAAAAQSGYYKLTVTYISTTGSHDGNADNDFTVSRTGDAGSAGATGPTGVTGATGSGTAVVTKSGGTTTDGNADATIAFSTNFASSNYAIVITAVTPGGGTVICTYSNKGTGGFDIKTVDQDSNNAASTAVSWVAILHNDP